MIAILAVKLIAETVNGVLSKFTVGYLWFGSRRTLSVCKKLVFYSHVSRIQECILLFTTTIFVQVFTDGGTKFFAS